jgi:hypothetical protein
LQLFSFVFRRFSCFRDSFCQKRGVGSDVTDPLDNRPYGPARERRPARPQRVTTVDQHEALVGWLPMTGEELTFRLDDIESFQVIE